VNTLPIRHVDSDGNLLVRDGLILAFFAPRPFADMAAGVASAFDEWLKFVPADSLKWAKVGANAEDVSPADSRTISRCRALLDPAKAQKRDPTAFSIEGPEAVNPGFRFQVFGTREIKQRQALQQTNLVEMRFPTEILKEKGIPTFISLSTRIAEAVPYDSGYCSIALNWAAEGLLSEAGVVIVPLAMRHPGFDVHRNLRTRGVLGRQLRGPGWLTFVSVELVETLGGEDQLRHKLDPGVEVARAGNGLLLRAGEAPEIADVNRKERLPLLRSVARAIEPVTRFRDKLLEGGVFNDDSEKFQRWLRRFLD